MSGPDAAPRPDELDPPPVDLDARLVDLDPRLVDLYDEDNPDGPDHDFFRALADRRGATDVLDLGCGTGILTVTLARPGRRVVGVDPSAAMLDRARTRPGTGRVTWVHGDSSDAPAGPYDLALMSGNVAQHVLGPDWHRALGDLHDRLRPGGTLAFESRNPAVREWTSWEAGPEQRRTRHGLLTEWSEAEEVDDGVVRLTAHNRFDGDGEVVTVVQSLAFRTRAQIEADLDAAGFDLQSVLGGWHGEPLDESARLMVFVASRR